MVRSQPGAMPKTPFSERNSAVVDMKAKWTAENRFTVETNRKSVSLAETWNEDFDEGN